MQQMDFPASVAAVTGVAVPFGNVGKVTWHLWRVTDAGREGKARAWHVQALEDGREVVVMAMDEANG